MRPESGLDCLVRAILTTSTRVPHHPVAFPPYSGDQRFWIRVEVSGFGVRG